MHDPGYILDGRYRIDGVLGRGGMGGVYEATQLALGKAFAIKEMLVVLPTAERLEAATRQFRTEAQILHSLEHPGLPRLYDFFEAEGNCYLVMELIRGKTLEQLADLTVPETLALGWLQQICAVLQYLHGHKPQVIFRDLKPSNVMVNEDGHVKLIDFGIAKVWEASDEGTATSTGIRGLCSPGYAAPEQYGGGTDERTDIYALGATMYTVLTAKVPPTSVDMASGRKLEPLRSLRPDVSEKTEKLIEWMMALPLSKRPQNIQEVIDAAEFPAPEAVVPAPGPDTRRPGGLGRSFTRSAGLGVFTSRLPKSGRWVAPVLGFGGVGLLAVLGLAGHNPSHVPPPPAHAIPIKVLVVASPDGTKLFEDGTFRQLVGADGALVSFPAGHHKLTFTHDGYREYRTTVDVSASTTDIHAVLNPLAGQIEVRGTARARLTVDGQPVGQLPLSAFEVGAGRHVLGATLPGYHARSMAVDVPPGETRQVNLNLSPETYSRPVRYVAHHPYRSYTTPHRRRKRSFFQRLFHRR